MKAFNAFQITSLFATFPFAIGWLANQSFPWRDAAVGLAGLVYFFGFCCMTAVVWDNLE